MEYNGYTIEQDKTGYAPKHLKFHFFELDNEIAIGSGESLEQCKNQIDEFISYKIEEEKMNYAIRFSNWLDKNYINKKGAYFHKGDWEFSNGENNKKKLILIFNEIVV